MKQRGSGRLDIINWLFYYAKWDHGEAKRECHRQQQRGFLRTKGGCGEIAQLEEVEIIRLAGEWEEMAKSFVIWWIGSND